MKKNCWFCLLIGLMVILSGLVPIINVNADVNENNAIAGNLMESNEYSTTPITHNAESRPPLTDPCTSCVQTVDGNPKLFIDGEESEITGFYLTDTNDTKKYIDKASELNLTFVIYPISWIWVDKPSVDWVIQNLDKMKDFLDLNQDGRLREGLDLLPEMEVPDNAADVVNFTLLDVVFDYAASKGVYVVPSFMIHPQPPLWWAKNFPEEIQESNEKGTDGEGKLSYMVAFNAPAAEKYSNQVVTAMAEKYRDHPALLGWHLAFGWTQEDNYPGREYYASWGWYDYSPVAKQRFQEWLKEKYDDDVLSLRDAWEDPAVTFENAEIPQPLSNIIDIYEQVEWINGPGDTRRQWYDWQLFRLEEKNLALEKLTNLYELLDQDHIIMQTPGTPLPSGLSNALSMAINYDKYLSLPVDIIFVNPGVTNDIWEESYKIAGGISFAKYFETHGKATFIKWENWQDPESGEELDLETLREVARFSRKLGIGLVLWGNKIPMPGENDFIQPEFTDEQINAFYDTFDSIPEEKSEKSEFLIIENKELDFFDYYRGMIEYKAADMIGLAGLLYSAGLDFDVLSINEIMENPEILNDYKAVALDNIYRMNDTLCDILMDYGDAGGGLFIVGKTGVYDQYGLGNLNYLERLLGINSLSGEYNQWPYSWTYSNANDILLRDIAGCKGDEKSGYNVLCIPTFNYTSEKYKVLGRLDENSDVTTVGYKDKVVFWFPRLGMQLIDIDEEDLETTKQFLRNLYDFFDVYAFMVDITKPKDNYIYVFDKEIMPSIFGSTIVIGKITIEAEAYDEDRIDRVEFYVDNALKSTDNESPYEWLWDETIFGQYEIQVVAYDNEGNTASDSQEVWIFNI